MNKKTIPTRIGFSNAKIYQIFLILISIALTIVFTFKFEPSYNYIFVLLAILPLLFHLFKVRLAKNPIEFKPLLKQLAASNFFYSIFISIFMIYESIFF